MNKVKIGKPFVSMNSNLIGHSCRLPLMAYLDVDEKGISKSDNKICFKCLTVLGPTGLQHYFPATIYNVADTLDHLKETRTQLNKYIRHLQNELKTMASQEKAK